MCRISAASGIFLAICFIEPEVVGERVRECFAELGDLRQLEAGHDPFLIWCQVVEQSMADKIREAGLHAPKRFFGRGNRPELKQKQLPRAPRKGRCGDYQPTVATFSVQSRQVVRQYRRLQHLKQMSRCSDFGSVLLDLVVLGTISLCGQ